MPLLYIYLKKSGAVFKDILYVHGIIITAKIWKKLTVQTEMHRLKSKVFSNNGILFNFKKKRNSDRW